MKKPVPSVLLAVALLVSTAGALELKYVQLGASVTLDPPVVTGQHYLTWYKGKEEIAWSNHFGDVPPKDNNFLMSEKKLTIRNVSQELFATFRCLVPDTGIEITYEIRQLHVSKRPESPVLSGDSVTLDCHAATPPARAQPEIHWLDPRGARVGGSGATHTFTAAIQHHGRWTCVLTSGRTSSTGFVSVSVADLATPASPHRYTSSASPLTIPCSLSNHDHWEFIKAAGFRGGHWDFFPKTGSGPVSVNPQRIFSLSLEDPAGWRAQSEDRELIPASGFEKGDLSLARSRGREEDAGDYVCRLEFNNSRSLERTVHLQVLQIVSSPGTTIVAGQTFNLTCGLGSPLPPQLRLRWVPPGRSPLDAESSLLRITAESGHSGKWRCELWNNRTVEATAEITLKIEPRLSGWMLVIICSAAAIGFLLVLLLFICWQRRQRRIRNPRRRLCKCKNPKPKGFYRT